MRLSREHSSVRVAARRVVANNLSESKEFAQELVNFLRDSQALYRRMETAARRWKTNLKSEE